MLLANLFWIFNSTSYPDFPRTILDRVRPRAMPVVETVYCSQEE